MKPDQTVLLDGCFVCLVGIDAENELGRDFHVMEDIMIFWYEKETIQSTLCVNKYSHNSPWLFQENQWVGVKGF